MTETFYCSFDTLAKLNVEMTVTDRSHKLIFGKKKKIFYFRFLDSSYVFYETAGFVYISSRSNLVAKY